MIPVHSVCFLAITINLTATNRYFSTVQGVFYSRKCFEPCDGLFAVHIFSVCVEYGNGFVLQVVAPVYSHTHTSDCEITERINVGYFKKLLPEFKTTTPQYINVRITVILQLFFHVEYISFFHFLGMPIQKIFTNTILHCVNTIVLDVRNRSDIFLVFYCIEKVWKISFFQLFKSERLGER